MRKHFSILSAVCLMLVCSVAQADIFQFNVTINGAQEVPATGSPGVGSAIAIFNDATGAITINGSYSGLVGTANNSHLHGFAPAGTNAGVLFNITHGGGNAGVITATNSIPLANVAQVMGGQTYINIHSTQFPGGEIRGQLVNPVLIPEPSALALLGLGVCGVTLRRRRK